MDMDTTYRCTYKSKHIYSIWCLCSGFMISSNSVTLALEDPIRAQHVSRLKTVQLSERQPMRDQWTRRKAKKALPTCWVFRAGLPRRQMASNRKWEPKCKNTFSNVCFVWIINPIHFNRGRFVVFTSMFLLAISVIGLGESIIKFLQTLESCQGIHPKPTM